MTSSPCRAAASQRASGDTRYDVQPLSLPTATSCLPALSSPMTSTAPPGPRTTTRADDTAQPWSAPKRNDSPVGFLPITPFLVASHSQPSSPAYSALIGSVIGVA